jgi:hypothetical protein
MLVASRAGICGWRHLNAAGEKRKGGLRIRAPPTRRKAANRKNNQPRLAQISFLARNFQRRSPICAAPDLTPRDFIENQA